LGLRGDAATGLPMVSMRFLLMLAGRIFIETGLQALRLRPFAMFFRRG
jgi:hypothetical protein